MPTIYRKNSSEETHVSNFFQQSGTYELVPSKYIEFIVVNSFLGKVLHARFILSCILFSQRKNISAMAYITFGMSTLLALPAHTAFSSMPHSATTFESMLRHKENAQMLHPQELFLSQQAIVAATDRPYNDTGPIMQKTSQSEVVEKVAKLTSSNGPNFDHISVFTSQSSNIDNKISITTSITESIISAVKPEYRPIFSVGR